MQTHSLVTGGAGFIGSHVADELLKRGHRVTVVDDLSGGKRANIPTAAAFERLDITLTDAVNEIFDRNKFDYVFHLAAYAAEGLSHFIRHFNYQNNILGSINLINASVRTGSVKCFVYTSSIAVYGQNQTPMNEAMTPRPEDPYGIAKYAVELDLAAAYKLFSLPHIIFRPHNVYGERQNISDRYRNVIGIFIRQALRGEPFLIFGDGLQRRAFTYISDVAPLIAESIDVPQAYNQVFNLGSDLPATVNDVAVCVAREIGVPLLIRHEPERHEVKHAFSSHTKCETVFGARYEPTPIDVGIQKMCRWAKSLGLPEPSERVQTELRINLPPSWQ